MKRIGLSIIPLIVLAALVVVLFKHADALPTLRNSWLTLALPYAVSGLAGLLAWRFNKSMLAMLCLYLALLHLGLTRIYTKPPFADDFRLLASLTTPFVFAWFYLGRERGMLNEHGIVRLLCLLFVMLVVALGAQFFGGFPGRLIPVWFLQPVSGQWLPVAKVALALFFAVWLLLVYPSIRRDPIYGALMAAVLVAVLVAFCVVSKDFVAWQSLPTDGNRSLAGWVGASLALSTAGVLALYAILEISHGTAFVDQLTQLLGRRALDYRLDTLAGGYAIAMVDIDHFKKVNDVHGHEIGDQALRFIAARLRTVRGGKTYRYGGEEFAIVFPRQSIDQVEPILNALRETIQTSTFRLRDSDRPGSKLKGARKRNRGKQANRELKLTVSIGVADSFGGEDRTPQDVIVDADQALYKAKKAGRNRVVPAHRRKLDVSRVLWK